MATVLTAEELQDDLAVSLARLTAAANRRARELDLDVEQSLLTITQCAADDELLWRFNYGPRNYVGRRGGDLILEIDPRDACVKREMWGQ